MSAGRNTMSVTGETGLTSDGRESLKVVATPSSHSNHHQLLSQSPFLPQLQLQHRSQLPTILPSSPSASPANVDTKTTTGRRYPWYPLASHLLLRVAAMSDRVTMSTAMPTAGGNQHPRKLLWTPTRNTDDASNKKQSVLAEVPVTEIATLTARRAEGARRMSVTGLEAPKIALARLPPGIAP